MITRTMLLALGKDATNSIGELVGHRRGEVAVEAAIKVETLTAKGSDIKGADLLDLYRTGKNLDQLDRANDRIGGVIENWDTGGKPPRIKQYHDEPWESDYDLDPRHAHAKQL